MTPTPEAMNAECDQHLARLRDARDSGHSMVKAVAPDADRIAGRLRVMLPGSDETVGRALMAVTGKLSASAHTQIAMGTPPEAVVRRLLATLAVTAESLNRGAQP